MKRSTMLVALLLCACGQGGAPDESPSPEADRGSSAGVQAARTDLLPDFPGSTPVEFRKAGIPIRADTANAAGGLISVARDGERGAMVTISRIGDKTRIAVMAGPR